MEQTDLFPTRRAPRFDGDTYDAPRDGRRLAAEYRQVFRLMKDGAWRTLAEIEAATGRPQAGISARLRDMRKARFGGHVVNRRYVDRGIFEYQLVLR